MAVVIETTIGDFTIDLYTDERPQTCRNFLKLCKIKYYNWSLFHTVQSNFIAQTGDPTGTGKGGESAYGIALGDNARYYAAEQMPKIKHETSGLISMVNCGNNMLGSQFFITLAPNLQSLDKEHCVFGRIAEGLEIILKFNTVICDNNGRPYQDIRISHTVILEDPYEDITGLVIPDQSPGPTQEFYKSDRIRADEVINDTEGMTTMEIIEIQKNKEAKARATILEIVGDIPDAEMAPPENVLFVCKLNPVTNDDDLEIIFSRFGKIMGCEVIRDKKSGDSLQYAFIEFANRKSCEDAYFKMDNVLIDDRRIHVDFSQSVAKMRWRGKGKGIKYYDNEGQEDNKARPKDKSSTRDPKYNRDRSYHRRNENKSQRDRSKESLQKHNKGSNSYHNDRDVSRQRNKMMDRREHRRERSKDRRVHKSREPSKDQKYKDRRDIHNDNKHKHYDVNIRKKKKQVSSSESDEDSDSHTKKHEHSKKHKSENMKRRRKKYSSDSDDESTSDDTSSEESKPSRKRRTENKKSKKKKSRNNDKDDESSSDEEKRSSRKKKHIRDRSKDRYVKKNKKK